MLSKGAECQDRNQSGRRRVILVVAETIKLMKEDPDTDPKELQAIRSKQFAWIQVDKRNINELKKNSPDHEFVKDWNLKEHPLPPEKHEGDYEYDYMKVFYERATQMEKKRERFQFSSTGPNLRWSKYY